MTSVLGVISAKGGVGKTTTTANLAAALAQKGYNVTAVDGNITTPNLSIHLGCALYPVTLHDVLLGRAPIEQAIYHHPCGMRVVPASLAVSDLCVKPEMFQAAVSGLLRGRGLLIIDGAAGLGREARAVMAAADSLLIVTNPDIPSVTDALKAVRLAAQSGKPVLGVVLNRVGAYPSQMSAEEVVGMMDVPVLVSIPEDGAVPASIAAQTPVVLWKPRSRAARAYKHLAGIIVGEREPEAGSLLESLLGFFRR